MSAYTKEGLGAIHKGCVHIFSNFRPPCTCLHLADLPPPVCADTRLEKYSLANIAPSRFISYPFTLYYKLCYIIIILYTLYYNYVTFYITKYYGNDIIELTSRKGLALHRLLQW